MYKPNALSKATKRTPTADECPLFMECVDEGPSEAQKRARTDQSAKFKEQIKKFQAMAEAGATMIQQNNTSVTFRATTRSTLPTRSSSSTGPIKASGGQAVKLLMDRHTGKIVGTLNPDGTVVSSQPSTSGLQYGGNRAVKQPTVIDLTRDDGNGNDKARQFPSLTVSVRTQKVATNLPEKRGQLDKKVKAMLMQPADKFTEWLIQHGLVPSDQHCGVTKKKRKLGKYSDNKKFPHSGGYVWISEGSRGQQKQYVSVFKGSMFETSNHSPTVVLKLLYHWSCQTNIQNVIQWVKVDYNTINLFYQIFRSVCVCSIQEEVVNMGGPGKAVEIGIISLGTTSADGKKRKVYVEILGVLDSKTGNVRLRATESRPNISQAERFNEILAPLSIWVLKDSKILTDYSIDKDRLNSMGYTDILQCNMSVQNRRTTDSNGNVMDYLKKIVPKMFRNSLSILTMGAIQQSLDELTFRELHGHHSLLAFDSLVQRVSTQTAASIESGTTFSARMKSVAARPSDDWRITLNDY